MRDRIPDVENLDKIVKSKNVPEGQQEAFKTGFAEGFLKAQALTQRTTGNLGQLTVSVAMLKHYFLEFCTSDLFHAYAQLNMSRPLRD